MTINTCIDYPVWLFGDHLGSTSTVISYDGLTKNSEQMYKPWGEKRYPTGAPTLPAIPRSSGQAFQFTG